MTARSEAAAALVAELIARHYTGRHDQSTHGRRYKIPGDKGSGLRELKNALQGGKKAAGDKPAAPAKKAAPKKKAAPAPKAFAPGDGPAAALRAGAQVKAIADRQPAAAALMRQLADRVDAGEVTADQAATELDRRGRLMHARDAVLVSSIGNVARQEDRKKADQPAAADPVAAVKATAEKKAAAAAPPAAATAAPTSGRVPIGDVKPGNYAEVAGFDVQGRPRSATGWVTSAQRGRWSPDGRTKMRDMVMVKVSEHSPDSDRKQTLYVDPTKTANVRELSPPVTFKGQERPAGWIDGADLLVSKTRGGFAVSGGHSGYLTEPMSKRDALAWIENAAATRRGWVESEQRAAAAAEWRKTAPPIYHDTVKLADEVAADRRFDDLFDELTNITGDMRAGKATPEEAGKRLDKALPRPFDVPDDAPKALRVAATERYREKHRPAAERERAAREAAAAADPVDVPAPERGARGEHREGNGAAFSVMNELYEEMTGQPTAQTRAGDAQSTDDAVYNLFSHVRAGTMSNDQVADLVDRLANRHSAGDDPTGPLLSAAAKQLRDLPKPKPRRVTKPTPATPAAADPVAAVKAAAIEKAAAPAPARVAQLADGGTVDVPPPGVLRKIATTKEQRADYPHAESINDLSPGDVVFMSAHGDYRRGVVTGKKRSNVTVAYTTETSPNDVKTANTSATNVLKHNPGLAARQAEEARQQGARAIAAVDADRADPQFQEKRRQRIAEATAYAEARQQGHGPAEASAAAKEARAVAAPAEEDTRGRTVADTLALDAAIKATGETFYTTTTPTAPATPDMDARRRDAAESAQRRAAVEASMNEQAAAWADKEANRRGGKPVTPQERADLAKVGITLPDAPAERRGPIAALVDAVQLGTFSAAKQAERKEQIGKVSAAHDLVTSAKTVAAYQAALANQAKVEREAKGGAGPLAGMSTDDQQRIRNAVADRGPGIYASPAVGGSKSDVGRYLAEGELGKQLADRHDWRTVWQAVREVIDENPAVLERNPDQAKADVEARAGRVKELVDQAQQSVKTDKAQTVKLLDKALALDPDAKLTEGGRAGYRLSEVRASVAKSLHKERQAAQEDDRGAELTARRVRNAREAGADPVAALKAAAIEDAKDKAAKPRTAAADPVAAVKAAALEKAAAPRTVRDTELAIREAYDEITAGHGGSYARFDKVRERLDARGFTREQADAALTGLANGARQDARVVPIANAHERNLPAVKAAALRFGGESNEAIQFVDDDGQPIPGRAAAAMPGAPAPAAGPVARGADARPLKPGSEVQLAHEGTTWEVARVYPDGRQVAIVDPAKRPGTVGSRRVVDAGSLTTVGTNRNQAQEYARSLTDDELRQAVRDMSPADPKSARTMTALVREAYKAEHDHRGLGADPVAAVKAAAVQKVEQKRAAAAATELTIDGAETVYVPGARSTIGLADRPNIGRDAAPATQQLGLFANTAQEETQGQGALLDALLNLTGDFLDAGKGGKR